MYDEWPEANGRRDVTVGAIIFAGRQHQLERRTYFSHGAAAEKELFQKID